MDNPKEKAIELVSKFYNKQTNVNQFGISRMQKEFALICINEIIESNPKYPTKDGYDNYGIIYWQEVKLELEKL